MPESIGIEISAKDLTAQATAAVVKNMGSMRESIDAVAKSNQALVASNESIAKSSAASAGASTGLLALAGFAGISAAALAAGNAILAYHDSVKKSIAPIADMAAVTGFNTTQLQAYLFVADAAGVGQDKFSSSLVNFSGKMNAAAAGNKSAIEDFNTLGVKILDGNGKLRDQSTILTEVATALLGMTNADQRATVAKDLLGVSGARLLPLLRELAAGMGDIERKAKDAGGVISQEVVEAANRLENQSHATSIEVRKLYAEIGVPIELKWLSAVESTVKSIAGAYDTANDAVLRFIRSQANSGLDREIGSLDKGIASAQKSLDSPSWLERQVRSPGSAAAIQADIDAMKKRRDAAIAEKQANDALYQGYNQHRTGADRGAPAGTVDWVPDSSLNARAPVAKSGKSGGSGSSRDRIGESILQLQAETVAAQQALDAMLAGAQQGLPLKAVEDQANLQKKIADEIAKLGKYDANDPRLPQLKAEVTAHEQIAAKLRDRTAAEKDAVEVEKRLGDGSVQYQITVAQLNQDLATGRLTFDAYNAAMREAKDKYDDMGRAARGAKGGVDGFFAGFQQGAANAAKAQTPFQLGIQAYNDSFNILKQTTSDWATTGVLDINKFGSAMINMIAQVGLALVQSELTKFLQGTIGGGISGPQGGYGSIGSLIGNIGTSGNGFFGDIISGIGGFLGFAGGGDPPVGVPSIVGEKGPEMFVPKTAGTIFNRQQLAGMSGGGAGDTYTINQTLHFGAGVNRSELRQWAESVKQQSVLAMVAARRTGQYRDVFK